MRPEKSSTLLLCLLLLSLGTIHVLCFFPSEPFYNGDETRHVMTGVFFRDVFINLPLLELRKFTTDYYLQYPALGLGVWPPLFYVLEGLVMLIFGTSMIVAKVVILGFTALAATYFFRLVSYTHDARRAWIAAMLFVLTPMIFVFSQHVMLEMPTLAFCLMGVFHWLRFLDNQKRRDLSLAVVAAALAALTRFDAVWLLLALALLTVVRRKVRLLSRKDVLIAGLLAGLVLVPFYLFTATEFGAIKRSMPDETLDAGYLSQIAFYPKQLPVQVGWFVLIAAVPGLWCMFRPDRRASLWPYIAIIAAVYCVFTPIAELDARHSICWIPAWVVLAIEGAGMLRRFRWAEYLVPALLLAGTSVTTFLEPRLFVQGYSDAATAVVAGIVGSDRVFFDGWLDGNFIYQIRLQDRQRHCWVLRGDKILYSVVGGSRAAGYSEYATTDNDVLRALFEYAPSLIVVESRSAASDLAPAQRLRAVLHGHPERFQLVSQLPIRTNARRLQGTTIDIYKNLARDPEARRLEFQMPQLGRRIGTKIPERGE